MLKSDGRLVQKGKHRGKASGTSSNRSTTRAPAHSLRVSTGASRSDHTKARSPKVRRAAAASAQRGVSRPTVNDLDNFAQGDSVAAAYDKFVQRRSPQRRNERRSDYGQSGTSTQHCASSYYDNSEHHIPDHDDDFDQHLPQQASRGSQDFDAGNRRYGGGRAHAANEYNDSGGYGRSHGASAQGGGYHAQYVGGGGGANSYGDDPDYSGFAKPRRSDGSNGGKSKKKQKSNDKAFRELSHLKQKSYKDDGLREKRNEKLVKTAKDKL